VRRLALELGGVRRQLGVDRQSRLCGIRRRLGTEGLDVGLSPALRGDLLARSLQKTLGLDTRVLDDHGCLILRDPQHVLEPLALAGGLAAELTNSADRVCTLSSALSARADCTARSPSSCATRASTA
jgi:hypothetical protein